MVGQPRIGLQLYGVRDAASRDLPRTLDALAAMGYTGVEFHDSYGHSARTLRRFLDDAGLVCCGFHTRPFAALAGEALDRVIEDSLVLGNPFVLLPGPLPDEFLTSPEALARAVSLVGEADRRLSAHAIRLGYHNEADEFVRRPWGVPWDELFRTLPETVFFQLDTGNTAAGGADVLSKLNACRDRLTSVHVKAFSRTRPNALLGDDELPWDKILGVFRASRALEWIVLEYEADLYEPMEAMAKSYLAFGALQGGPGTLKPN